MAQHVQLVTAGGTFPWQTIPVPLHGLHHVLVLLAYLVGALALTSIAAVRRRQWTVSRIKPELSL
jgi:putative membrane protein